jgi:hypothetical protein
MSLAVTPELKLEVEQLIEDRRLSAVDGQRLFAAIVGDGGKARDAPFFAAAQLMSDLLTVPDAAPLRRRIDTAIALVMDTSTGNARRIEARLAANPARATRESGTRGRTELSAGLVLFLLTTGNCTYFTDMRAAFGTAAEAAPDDEEALPELARAFGRIIYKVRQAHLPQTVLGKEHLALIRFLQLNGVARRGGAITDELILHYWLERVRAGARLTYRSAVLLLLAYEQLQFDEASLAGLRDAADVTASDWDETAGASATAEGLAGSAAGDALATRLDGLPQEPKMLTQAERERLRRVFALAPYHRAKPQTVLRFLSFGDAQAWLIQQARMGELTQTMGAQAMDRAMTCASTYVEAHTAYGQLAAHLIRLMEVARLINVDKSDTIDEPLVRKKLAGFRRAGFDRPLAELTEVFDEISSDLSMIGLGAGTFTAAIGKIAAAKPLAQRYTEDTEVFTQAFHAMFGPGTSHAGGALDDDDFI